MRNIWGGWFLLCVIGCFGLREQEERLARMNDPQRALLFGYINLSEATFRVKAIEIMESKPTGERAYWETSVDKTGSFLFADLPLSTFSISCLVGNQGDTTVRACFEKEKLNKTTIRLGAVGVYYWGSWEYQYEKLPIGKRGIFSLPAFDLTLANEPDAMRVLQMLTQKLEKTRWYEATLPYLNKVSQ